MDSFLKDAIRYAMIPLFFVVFFLVYRYFPSVPHDNIAEELAEKFIRGRVGVDIDLSPDPKE